MPPVSKLRRYIVLPATGFRSTALAQSAWLRVCGPPSLLKARPALRALAAGEEETTAVRVLDSLNEDGPKLVEMTPEAELNLRAGVPGLKIVPVIGYRAMRAGPGPLNTPRAAPSNRPMSVRLVDARSGAGLGRATVVAFTDFRNRRGEAALSDADGLARMERIAAGAPLDRLYVYPPPGFWGRYAGSGPAPEGGKLSLTSLDAFAEPDLLARFCTGLPVDAGRGVRVAIIDTGVARAHPALRNVGGGANVVFDEVNADPGAAHDWDPAAIDGEHGTHVAGIVGGLAPEVGFRGVAPGVELRSYRVFPRNGGEAQNYDIVAAMARAVTEGCHILNLSLGGGLEDEALRAAIDAASEAGVLVAAAAGNAFRKPVAFPAEVDACLAVTAYGRRGSFPGDSVEAADVAKPFGDDASDFFAGFSNFGPQVDVVGPGVGIVSCLPGGAYGVMSGTSMACPAIVGFAAHLLASRADLQAASGPERATLWRAALYGLCRPLGFGRSYEGFGLPRSGE